MDCLSGLDPGQQSNLFTDIIPNLILYVFICVVPLSVFGWGALPLLQRSLSVAVQLQDLTLHHAKFLLQDDTMMRAFIKTSSHRLCTVNVNIRHSVTKLFCAFSGVTVIRVSPSVTPPAPPGEELSSGSSSGSPPSPPSGTCLHVGSDWAPAERWWSPSSAPTPCIVAEGTTRVRIQSMRHSSDDFWTWISNSLVWTVSLTKPGGWWEGRCGIPWRSRWRARPPEASWPAHSDDTNKAVCKHSNINGNKLCSLTWSASYL